MIVLWHGCNIFRTLSHRWTLSEEHLCGSGDTSLFTLVAETLCTIAVDNWTVSGRSNREKNQEKNSTTVTIYWHKITFFFPQNSGDKHCGNWNDHTIKVFCHLLRKIIETKKHFLFLVCTEIEGDWILQEFSNLISSWVHRLSKLWCFCKNR